MGIIIIAEIGTSHGGSLSRAKKLIDMAKESGANCVKFQWVYAEEILHKLAGQVSLPCGKVELYNRFRELEVSKEFFTQIRQYCKAQGVLFCCSPFGQKSLRNLLEINPDFVKIASPELNHFELLEQLNIAETNSLKIPVIISTGVSRLCDIEAALDRLHSCEVSILHCVTSYPAPESEYNLNVLESLQAVFGKSVGISDHSLDAILVPVLSVACGATIIEKHITLDKSNGGLDDDFALPPSEFLQMSMAVKQAVALRENLLSDGDSIEAKIAYKKAVIRQLEEQYPKEKILRVLGNGVKKLARSEVANYERTRRSLHYLKAKDAGEVITSSDIAALRTERVLSVGVSPEYTRLLVGKTLLHSVASGAGVRLEDFML